LLPDALRTSEIILVFAEWYRYNGFQVGKVLSRTTSGRRQLEKSLAKKKKKGHGFDSGA
jgi:hypothetical protein